MNKFVRPRWKTIVSRMNAGIMSHCVVCAKIAKKKYGHISHTDACICSKRCSDVFEKVLNLELKVGILKYQKCEKCGGQIKRDLTGLHTF